MHIKKMKRNNVRNSERVSNNDLLCVKGINITISFEAVIYLENFLFTRILDKNVFFKSPMIFDPLILA